MQRNVVQVQSRFRSTSTDLLHKKTSIYSISRDWGQRFHPSEVLKDVPLLLTAFPEIIIHSRLRDTSTLGYQPRTISMVEGIEGTRSYHDVILTETLKRKEILMDLSATRNPEANRKKFRAWKEIQDIVLVQCEKTMTIAQIKRVWRNKKAAMRDVLSRQKLRQMMLDGGCDLSLENSIVEVSPALTEAEIQLARCLVQEDVMRDHNKTAIFDQGGASDSSESTLEVTRRSWKENGHSGSRREEDGERGRRDPAGAEVKSFGNKGRRRGEDFSDFSEPALDGMRGWRDGGRAERSTKEDGRRKKKGSLGRKRSVWDSDSSESVTKSTKRGHRDDGWARKRRRQEDERSEEADSPELDRHELRRIRRKRVLQQLEDFDPDCSSSAESVSDKAIIDLQMKVLREEEVLIAKKSLALDIYMDVLKKQQQFYTSVLKRFQGSTEEVKQSNCDPQQRQTFQSWNLAPYSALPMPPDLKSASTFL